MKRTARIDADNACRRSWMKATVGGCAALTNTSLLSTIFNLSATNAAVGQQAGLSGYRAMVCVFLFGGNDSYNLLSPATGTDRDDYVAARGGVYAPGNGALALAADASMNISNPIDGKQYMLHPSMTGVKSLYESGKLTFLCNIGSMVGPTTRSDYDASLNLPLGLFSHADLQQHWMTTVPQTRSQVDGWVGRMADVVTGDSNVLTNPNISMNMAVDDVNLLQTGGTTVPYVLGQNGATEVGMYGQNWTQAKIFTQMTDDYLSRSYNNLLEQTFANQNKIALEAAIEYNDAANSDAVQNLVDQHFPDTSTTLSKRLRRVARTIAASGALDVGNAPTLGQSRQTFFVSQGGYDHHDELINAQDDKLDELDTALTQFQNCMDALGVADDVTTFTASDFARTLNSNGKGSDHAWGGISMVMGGSVYGSGNTPRFFGEYPSLAFNTDLDLGRGRLLPTLSVDEMACELAMWYGVPNDSHMEQILPNIRNFHAAGGTLPIGMLG